VVIYEKKKGGEYGNRPLVTVSENLVLDTNDILSLSYACFKIKEKLKIVFKNIDTRKSKKADDVEVPTKL